MLIRRQKHGKVTGGIDLGGTKIAAAVVGPEREIIGRGRNPTPTSGGPAAVEAAIVETMKEAASEAGLTTDRLDGIGLGAPGSVDPANGTLARAGNLPDWDDPYPLGPRLSEHLGTRMFIGNDVQVGTAGEYRLGAGRGYDSLLGVFWGTGVGGGLILGGRAWKGRGSAGEIGHTLVRRGGAPEIGRLRGTVEAYAGRKCMEAKARREVDKGRKTRLFKIMKAKGKTSLTSAVWAKAYRDGDELATDLIDRAVTALAAGTASAVNLVDVEAVVIGGGLGVRFGDDLVPKIGRKMERYLLKPDDPPALRVAELGDDGGVLGASLLVV